MIDIVSILSIAEQTLGTTFSATSLFAKKWRRELYEKNEIQLLFGAVFL